MSSVQMASKPPIISNMNLDPIELQQPQKSTETATREYPLPSNEVQPTVDKSSNYFNANDTSISPIEILPKFLYLKKVANPGLQLKTNTMKSSHEPIPKLIVSTKSIKMTNQYDQSTEGIRYVTATRKPEINDSPATKVDAIKSTKIIIKGITSQDKRLMVCESPTQDSSLSSPQLSPKLSPPPTILHVEFNKNETKNTINDENEPKADQNSDNSKCAGENDQPCSSFDTIAGSPTRKYRRYSGSKSLQKPMKESKILNDFIADDIVPGTPGRNREMKQLQKTMKESKILTDYITDGDTKDRRVKRKLDDDNDENEIIIDPEPVDASHGNIMRSRSLSSSTIDLNDAMISIRRNTRSLNAEFSAKQRKFLAGIQKHSRDSEDDHSDEEHLRGRRKLNKKSGKSLAPLKPGYDKYCWQCHQNDTSIACTHCKRTYHMECLKPKQIPKNENQKLTWQCPECCLLEASINDIEKAKYDFNELCTMLEFAHKRLKLTSKNLVVPSESENVVVSVNFSTMEQKIVNKQYQSTHAFLTDARWILHNCTSFYSRNAKLLQTAKSIFKICKQEMYDIDTCHECYYNANSCKTDWFVEVCSRPHILVWAKLKGFPYWPAKAMTTNSQGMVDVRFFGDHDRAFVPIRECFLYSEDHPNPITVKSKRQSIAHSVLEVNMYIKRLQTKFGSFVFPECKTLFDPFKEEEQLEQMIPNYKNYKNNLNNKKCTSNSDLTYKIVKTADNNLSIVKKNDTNIQQPPEAESTKIKHMERKHGRTSSTERQNEMNDDLSYQIMKCNRDSDSSRLDGRVDSVILKRKADAPIAIGETKKKSKLIVDGRRVSTPIVGKEPLNDEKSKDSIDKLSKNRQAAIAKHVNTEQLVENESSKRTDRKLSAKSKEAPSKDVTGKSNSKEDLISSVVKTLDTLQAFVSTSDNSKLKALDAIGHSNKMSEQEGRTTKNSKISSNNIVDNHSAVTKQRSEQNNVDRVIETHPNDERKCDEDENLLVPMHDHSMNESNDSKKEIQMAAITSSRQGSMSGSSVQSIAGSLDEPLEITIKSEPMSGDERMDDSSIPNDGYLETIMAGQDNRAPNGPPESNVAKISVKNINTLTNPLTQMQRPPITNRKMLISKSVQRPDLLKQRARKSFLANPKNDLKPITTKSSISPNIQHQPIKQSQNMVCIPMDRSSFQRIESIMLGNHSTSNPPPLAAVSSTPNITVPQKDQMSQPKNTTTYSTSTTVSSIGPPPLSLTTPLKLPDSAISTVMQPVQQSTISGTITDSFASAITDIMKHNEPKLTPKPVGPLRFEGTNQFTSEAGHYSKLLIDNSHKFADYFRSVFEVTLADIASMGCSEARIQLLELELEQCKLTHSKELEDLNSNYGMILIDMKKNFEAEKSKLINETRRQCELDRIRAVEDTKKRQWCVNCGKEAKFYCCWNTSYCDYPCQQQHWPRHMATCSQTEEFVGTNAKSYGAKVSDKGKEINHAQVAMRQFNNHPMKNAVLNNQSLQRVIAVSHQTKNNVTQNNSSQYKIVNRLNNSRIIMPTATSVSNAIMAANTATSNVSRANFSSQNK